MLRSFSFVLLLSTGMAFGQNSPPFPAAKHAGGELKYVQGIPVLTVSGTPKEIGEQFGVLAIKNAPDLTGLLERFLKDSGQEKTYPLAKMLAKRLVPNLSESHRTELDAAAKASGREAELLYFANAVYDLSSGMGCSTVVVSPERSATGKPIFGRNFDWLPTQGLTDHTLITVFKPKGKHAFASVTISPLHGVISGINEKGLAITINEIRLRQVAEKSSFNWAGTPILMLYRQVLEECSTVVEAEAFLNKANRTTAACMTACDTHGGKVFEITPKTVTARDPVNGCALCTNHLRTEKLARPGDAEKCWRYAKLEPLQKDTAKLGVNDVFTQLDAVTQKRNTLQSMVFEPTDRILHLKYSEGFATKKDAVKLDIAALLK